MFRSSKKEVSKLKFDRSERLPEEMPGAEWDISSGTRMSESAARAIMKDMSEVRTCSDAAPDPPEAMTTEEKQRSQLWALAAVQAAAETNLDDNQTNSSNNAANLVAFGDRLIELVGLDT